MAQPPAARRTGPRAFYRPKGHAVTLTLTSEGHSLLNEAARRTGASRADVVEQLLRRFGDEVDFPEEVRL